MNGSNVTVFERLGVRTVINAKGPSTRLSGGLLDPEVSAAMAEASRFCVDMVELQARASEIIAAVTGAESGLVTAGAAAGLTLGTAASVAGLDPARMERLPETRGMRNEVLVPAGHRNFYDRAVRQVGVKLIPVGISDRLAGAGVRDTEAWELDAAIGKRTAAVLYLAKPNQQPTLTEVVEVAHRRGVPVLVDAASQLPPKDNLRRFIAEGADLVTFSGGKALQGPQASGILCGRRDLVASAALQMLDWDLLHDQFDPPPHFIDTSRLSGMPHHGIGRPCKVGKEEIVGLLVALRRFVDDEDATRTEAWATVSERLRRAIDGVAHAGATVVPASYKPTMPGVRLILDEDAAAMTTMDLIHALERGTPSIRVDTSRAHERQIVFVPFSLRPEDPEAIGRRLREILG